MKRVRQFARKERLWAPGDRLLIAVSGGPDSMALLDVMAALARKEGLTLEVAHANYRLRGTQSDADEALVRKQAEGYGLPCHVKRFRNSSGSESALRDLRYAFFESLLKNRRLTGIVLAHHEDDQAETILLRLLRGSGRKGLSGMLPKNGVRLRPLLRCSRAEILRYLECEKLPFRVDESNRDLRYLRNRIRHELLPLLESRYQPAIRKRLAATAALLAEATIPLAPQVEIFRKPGFVSFGRDAFCGLAAPAGRALLRELACELQGKFPTLRQVEEMEKLVRSRKPKRQTMQFSGLKLEAIGDRVRLLKRPI